MMNCEQATRLLSEAQDRRLGTTERTFLRMHTWVCSGCRQFGGQLGFIRQAMQGFAAREDAASTEADAREPDDHGSPPPGAV